MDKFDYMLLGGLALWLMETACFGWNLYSSGVPESMFNTISLCLMFYGFFGGLIAAYKNPHTVINAKELVIK